MNTEVAETEQQLDDPVEWQLEGVERGVPDVPAVQQEVTMHQVARPQGARPWCSGMTTESRHDKHYRVACMALSGAHVG